MYMILNGKGLRNCLWFAWVHSCLAFFLIQYVDILFLSEFFFLVSLIIQQSSIGVILVLWPEEIALLHVFYVCNSDQEVY